VAPGWQNLQYCKGSAWETSGGSLEIEESDEESEEGSKIASAVSAMEAKLSASTSTSVSFDEPWVAVGAAGGAAVDSTVSAKDAAISVIDARSSASKLVGARFEEPLIAAEARGEAVLELTILATEAGASESSWSATFPLGLWPASKETINWSSVLMVGQLTISIRFRSGQSSQSNSMVAIFFNSASDLEIGWPSIAFQVMSAAAARPR